MRELRLETGFWYLATPYSQYPGGLNRAFEDACRVAGALIAEGVSVYCPIAHSHPIAMHGALNPRSYALWLPLDERMMEAAHGIIVVEMPGWDRSTGVAHERSWMACRGRPEVRLMWPSLLVRKAAA